MQIHTTPNYYTVVVMAACLPAALVRHGCKTPCTRPVLYFMHAHGLMRGAITPYHTMQQTCSAALLLPAVVVIRTVQYSTWLVEFTPQLPGRTSPIMCYTVRSTWPLH